MKKIFFFLLLLISIASSVFSQQQRWQQSVRYSMDIDVDTFTNRLYGKQKLEYTNNSNETLDKVFYHLYWNAFQPNSSMDMRSRELGKNTINGRADWDGRVRDRISHLSDKEIGYQKIISLRMNGVPQVFTYHETILEVKLTSAISPKSKVVFEMEYESQVPLQVRRSGRDNPQTGVRYSMSQWYPKLCEYDEEGWHPTPYVAREFYGVWGDFDVTIHIAPNYKIGGTGVLINAQEVGWGYSNDANLRPCHTAKRTWHFVGKNIHDFVWAADPDYKHIVRKIANGPAIHVIYNGHQSDSKWDSSWVQVADAAIKVLPFIESNFGKYPYPQYSFIHGGDGGMEYPMATLVSSPSLGTAFHEWMHSWYQMMLGTNESLYPWMDEGFTSYAENLVSKFYNQTKSDLDEYKQALEKNPHNQDLKALIASLPDQHADAYSSYFALVKSKKDEPMCTHADHYNSNFSYSINSYSKGEVFMEQLGYIIGSKMRDSVLLAYYHQWRFKHPNANDFFRVAEKVSGIQLDWYKEFWVHSTKTIDYSIDSIWEDAGYAKVRLKRIGLMPMPIDLLVTHKDGSKTLYQITLNLMFGSKKSELISNKTILEEEWKWTHPTYEFILKDDKKDITSIEIDPSKRMADVDRSNNVIAFP